MPPKDYLSPSTARAILATIWLSFPTLAQAQAPQPNNESTEVAIKETAANENADTAEPQDTESKDEKPDSPALGAPTQFIYNEAKRDPLLSRELNFIRGNATPIELAGKLETVTGVWQEDLSGKPIGGALILTPANISPSSIEIQNLQYYLALNGWSSLTITALPADATAPPPVSAIITPPPSSQDEDTPDSTEQDKQAENTNNQEEAEVDESEVVYQEPDEEKGSQQAVNQAPTASDTAASNPIPSEPVISNQEKMIERIELGFNALRDKNYFNNVLIAYDRSPVNFAEFLSTNERSESIITSLQAIVFVNAKTVNKDESMTLDATVELNLPTLDIINKTYAINTKAQTARRNRANQLKHPLYSTRQLQLGETNTGQENALSRAIRGFITKHASGTETNQ